MLNPPIYPTFEPVCMVTTCVGRSIYWKHYESTWVELQADRVNVEPSYCSAASTKLYNTGEAAK